MRSIPLQSAYCAAKAAIRGFTDSLRTELLHDGSHVRVSMLQLPSVNTPQFDVVRTRLPRQPKPVPPIYQPEVIAAAVVYAAEHPPREMIVGGGSLKAIVAQAFAPELLDRYLARTGYDAQQADTPVDPHRPDNLKRPVPGDHGARGRFDAEAKDRSDELWVRTHRPFVAMGAVAAIVVAVCWRRAARAFGCGFLPARKARM